MVQITNFHRNILNRWFPRLKDIEIAKLIIFGFGLVIFFVIMLGMISHLQTDKIHQQTEIMYKHPLIVRRALDVLINEVLKIRLASHNLVFELNDQKNDQARQLIFLSSANILEQFNILRETYLGPTIDVEEAYEAFVKWRNVHQKFIQLNLSKKSSQVNDSEDFTDELTALREQLTVNIKKIDDFAKNKSDELFIEANKLYHSLNKQLIQLVSSILLLSFVIIYILLRNIRNPLIELTVATQRFHNGIMDARSFYESKNELGILSSSFNRLAEKIQKNSKKLENQKTELRILSAQLMSAEERERKRIASDIHDTIGQALSAIKFSVETALIEIEAQSYSTATNSLERVIPLTKQSIEEVRRIIMDLRPSMLDDLGLIATISWFCREYQSIYGHIRIEKEIQVEEADIVPSLKTVIYRILLEALNNVAKHSRTEIVYIHLMKSQDELELMIEDTGYGFEMAEVLSRNIELRGMGLASMKERAKLSGGTFKVNSVPGAGTNISISWPIETISTDQD